MWDMKTYKLFSNCFNLHDAIGFLNSPIFQSKQSLSRLFILLKSPKQTQIQNPNLNGTMLGREWNVDECANESEVKS